MANSKYVFDDLAGKIRLPETQDEIHAIVYLLMEHYAGITRNDILSGREVPDPDQSLYDNILTRINNHEPVQYVIGEADFFGRRYFVNADVLIPRPETEQLLEIAFSYAEKMPPGRFVDVGTGSGCIGITFAKKFPAWEVVATDISQAALDVASKNAKLHDANITLLNHDILSEALPSWSDIICSNPPYIGKSEMESMGRNVTGFEPHIALFVDDRNPLTFYDALVSQAQACSSCILITEINERFGNEVARLFSAAGGEGTIVTRDINQKDRIVSALFKKTN